MSSAVRPKDKPLSAKLISCPWPHLIVDNFLAESVLAKSIAEINSDPHSFDVWKKGQWSDRVLLAEKQDSVDSSLLSKNDQPPVGGVRSSSNAKPGKLDSAVE